MLGLKPDVVLLYGIGDAQTAVTDKLKELAIPYMYVGEYLEESPLGKAEWLVALSELTDSRDKGIDVFREIPKRYQALKDLTASVEQRPTVMFNTPWNDSWVMPSTQSYRHNWSLTQEPTIYTRRTPPTALPPSAWKLPTD